MAPPAADRLRRVLRGLLRPHPGRAELACRLALTCTLAAGVAVYYGIPEPALVAYLVFFVARPDRTTSAMLAIALTLVATLIIGLLFGLSQVLLEHPLWRVAGMALISLALLFVTYASKLKAVGGTVTLVVAFALDLMGSVPIGELWTRGLLYGWLFVAIPAGLTLAVSLVWGPSPRRQVESGLALRLKAAAQVLRGIRMPDVLLTHLQQGDAELQTALSRVAMERGTPPQDVAALRWAVDSSVALLAAIVTLKAHEASPADRGCPPDIPVTLDAMAAVFEDGGYPIHVRLPAHHAASTPPRHDDAWRSVKDALQRFAEPPSTATPVASLRPREPFFAPDLWRNPDYWHQSVKTTLAAMVCYLVYTLLDWPGIHTAMLTCYIVSLSSVAESVEKLTLRLAGCLLGACLGMGSLLFVVPSIDSFAAYLALVGTGALASAWLAAGSPRIAYLGFQMAFAFFLCVIQGSGPSFDMTVARDRIIGILLGNWVAYLVATRLWPVSLQKTFCANLQEALARLPALAIPQADFRQRRALAEWLAAIGRLREDVWRMRYERWMPHAERIAAADHDRLLQDASVLACRCVTETQGSMLNPDSRESAPSDPPPREAHRPDTDLRRSLVALQSRYQRLAPSPTAP